MLLQTLGHATLMLTRTADDGAPLLITDPWIRGSCYWRSWWLDRYPSPDQVERLGRATYCYLTHEHPDHFHPPSLRKLGKHPTYLTPEFNRDQMGGYLRERGFHTRLLPAGRFEQLGDNVRVMSVPTVGNDSAFLIDTEHAFIANLNDARPGPAQLLSMRRIRQRVGRDKPCILLSSYSAAGLANSLYRDGQRVPFLEQDFHARYIAMLCRSLRADVYVPFASQVTFERPDTRWAMDFQVKVEDVRAHLRQKGIDSTAPYVTYDLENGRWTADESEPRRERGIEARVHKQVESERDCISDDDIARLEHKLRSATRGVLPVLFPRGIGFDLGHQQLHYDSLRGRVVEGRSDGSVRMRLPAQAVHDVLHTGYFSDLCIPMFTHVDLGREVPAAAIYLFFTLMQMHDVGATASLAGLRDWLRVTLRGQVDSLRAA